MPAIIRLARADRSTTPPGNDGSNAYAAHFVCSDIGTDRMSHSGETPSTPARTTML